MKQSLKKFVAFLKKYYPEILSIIVPIFVLLVTALFCELYPLGKFSFAKYDGYYQYPGFTSYFRSVLLGKNSLFYSFKGLLGYNFYATAIYYMFNPTNLLCIFFNNSNVLNYYSLIVYLRIALCGFTMCKFLRYKYKAKSNLYLVVFSSAYALMGYNICYFFNFMYFDVVALFPIVMIGLDKLINKEELGLYVFSLTLSILANFYIGYMVCIFCVLYFIYNYILLEKKNKRIIYKFLISSILCGIMCSIIILPIAYELFQGKAALYSDKLQTKYFSFNLNFLNIFYKIMPGSTAVFDIKYGYVNIYCSLFVIVGVIKYFFNKNISKKEKIVTGAFIAFFLLSISFNLIDYFWHLMQRPIWYPNRYIFTFVFFLIIISYKSYLNNEYFNMKWYYKLIIVAVLIALSIYPALKSTISDSPMQLVCYILSILMLIQYMLFSENKYAYILILGLFIIEVTLNSIMTMKRLSNSVDKESYDTANTSYEVATSNIKKLEKEGTFYRVEYTTSINYNNGAMYDYNGIVIFDSIRNGKIMNFFDKYFDYIVSDSASLQFNFKNPYMTSILGIKYLNGGSELYYDLVNEEQMKIYRNNDALSLGYMVHDSIYDYNFIEDEYFKNTEEIVNTMLNDKRELYVLLNNFEFHGTKIIYDEEKEKYQISVIKQEDSTAYTSINGIAEEDGFITSNRKANFYASAVIYINGAECESCRISNTTPVFLHKGDTYEYKIRSTINCDIDYLQYYFIKYSEYIHFINEMKSNELIITNYETDSHIMGTITSTKEKNILFTTIPYDKGWSIYVDGIKTKYNACYDAFICLHLNEGEHEIEFKYLPKLFITGTIISVIALISSILYIRKNKVK